MSHRFLLENGVDALLLENGDALRVEEEYFDRPQIVRGPFPFPKEKPAFRINTNDVTVALSGVAATAVIGTLATVLTLGISGVGGTGSVGTVTATNDLIVGLSGVGATSGLGSLGAEGQILTIDRPRVVRGPFPFPKERPAFSISVPTAALIGVQGTGSVGTPGVSVSVALSGVSGTGSPGTLTPVTGFTVALTGVQGTGSPGTLGLTVSVALSGVQATGALGVLHVEGVVAVIDRPHRLDGPFPFLPASFSGFRSKLPPVLPASVRLAGVDATTTPGTLAPTATVPLIGIATTGAVGQVGIGQGLIGREAQGSINSLQPATVVGLSGVSAAGAVGTAGAISGSGASLSGVQATGAAGILAGPVAEVVLSGVSGTGARGTLTVFAPALPFPAEPDVVIDVRPRVGIIDVRPMVQIIEVT